MGCLLTRSPLNLLSLLSLLVEAATSLVAETLRMMTNASTVTNPMATDPTWLLFPMHMKDPEYVQYYPDDWPSMPFHPGEIAFQQTVGVHDRVMSYAPRVIRPYLPIQHRDFYSHQPFLVVAARDRDGRMWSTLLMNRHGRKKAVDSASPTTLDIDAEPVPGDALDGELHVGTDVGILGIEFATKRRNRVNGRITAIQRTASQGPAKLTFSVDQSFGNCPQYIHPREWWWSAETDAGTMAPPASKRSTRLSSDQIDRVRQAQTVFVATGYRGSGKDVRFGNDASHRGGPAGFCQVLDDQTIMMPEFAGNNHFNSLGNLLLDDRMGITFPDFEHGGLLQVSGRATVDADPDRAAAVYPGALRLITLHIDRVNDVPAGSMPIRFSAAPAEQALMVDRVVQESIDVKSFYFKRHHGEPLWDFQAGQHLPIRLATPTGELLRTYSLSSYSRDAYRISVKLQRVASSFLHDHVAVGHTVFAQPPAGDFVIEDVHADRKDQPIVLLSAGIGVTPIRTMLEYLIHMKTRRPVIWMHGARDGEHHVFRSEVDELVAAARSRDLDVSQHVVYSQDPSRESSGRVDLQQIQRHVKNWKEADFYMCGPLSFLGNLELGLVQAGVNAERIHYETF